MNVMDWTHAGSWIMLAGTAVALIFSVACYRMIKTILIHVMRFDPSRRARRKRHKRTAKHLPDKLPDKDIHDTE